MDFQKALYTLKYGTGATYALLAINTLVFITAVLLSLVFPNSDGLVDVLGAVRGFEVFQGQVWRLITANYLQIEIFHFLLNAFALYYYGQFLERFYGAKKLFIVYTLTGLSGTLLAMITFGGYTLGASAAIWGFLGLMIGNTLKRNTYSPGLPIRGKDILSFSLLWLFLGGLIPGISFFGHLGGFIAGIVLGYLIDTENSFGMDENKDRLINLIFRVCVIASVLSFAGLVGSLFI